MSAFQHMTTTWCWGYAWCRKGLPRKTRSMLNLAMLTALNRPNEIKLHVKGALANGVTVNEIKEILLHATVYCGIPAGLDAFKVAHQVLVDEGAIAPRRDVGSTAAAGSCGGRCHCTLMLLRRATSPHVTRVLRVKAIHSSRV